MDVALTPPMASVATKPKLDNYRDALAYLFARTTGAFKFGLERTTALLAARLVIASVLVIETGMKVAQ